MRFGVSSRIWSAAATVVRSASKPIAGGAKFAQRRSRVFDQRSLGDHDARALDLFARLQGVASVGEECLASVEKQQQSVAAGVAAQVAQVRGMGDDEAVETFCLEGLAGISSAAPNNPSKELYSRDSAIILLRRWFPDPWATCRTASLIPPSIPRAPGSSRLRLLSRASLLTAFSTLLAYS